MKTMIRGGARHLPLLCLAMASAIGLAATTSASAEEATPPAAASAKTGVAKKKQTTLGLYVTAKEAYEKWKEAPDKVKIIDVRTPEEYLFVGYPTMAWKIPLLAQSFEWDAEKKSYPMKPLPDFVARVQKVAKTDDILLVTCRSGDRGAMAVNALAKAGFTNVYNIIDGVEGDGNGDSESENLGGWKNSGCPWTKKLTPERTLLPDPQ